MHPTHLCAPFRTRLEAFAHELPELEAGSVEALHHTRVASRRLREMLPLLELDRDVTRKLARRLRKVTKRLGVVRELDVLVLHIHELTKNNRYSPTALRRLAGEVAQERAASRRRLSAKLSTAKLERLVRKLEGVLKRLESGNTTTHPSRTKGAGRAGLWALDARVAQRGVRVHAAIDAAGAVYAPVHLHGVRVAVKRLRYAAELVAETTRKRIAGDITRLKAAQDLLGQLHDLEVLLARSRAAQAALSPPDLTAWRDLDSLVHAVEDDCRKLHARYMRDRPELIAVAHRMGEGLREAQPVARRPAV